VGFSRFEPYPLLLVQNAVLKETCLFSGALSHHLGFFFRSFHGMMLYKPTTPTGYHSNWWYSNHFSGKTNPHLNARTPPATPPDFRTIRMDCWTVRMDS